MKKILVLGAGFIARPLVRYLLELPEVELKIASRTLSKAEKLIDNHPHGRAKQLNVNNDNELKKVIFKADLVLSLLPWTLHLKVASFCLQLKKHLVTTSYVSPEMLSFDKEAQQKGLLFLNEIGVDPGIDHMAAMKIINNVKEEGGEILSFFSYCGGLPALESNNNPFGYKFSWSPGGVMLAAKNCGRYMNEGETIEVSEDQLFRHYWFVDIPGAGTFESYINRDALPYMDWYGIKTAKSIYRGTLRNISHCVSWDIFKKLDLLNQQKLFDFEKLTPRKVMAELINNYSDTLKKNGAGYSNITKYSLTFKKMQWLGLFEDKKIPLGSASAFDMFAYLLENKLAYNEGELDLLLQHHMFIAKYPDGRKEKITSTLINKGIPGGDSAMARTVSLPAAIATKLIINNAINLKGVHIPVQPEIYEPVLAELESMDIKLVERRSPV